MDDIIPLLVMYGVAAGGLVALLVLTRWVPAEIWPDFRDWRRPKAVKVVKPAKPVKPLKAAKATEVGHGFDPAPLWPRLAKVRAGYAAEPCNAGSGWERKSRVEAARRIIAGLGYFARKEGEEERRGHEGSRARPESIFGLRGCILAVLLPDVARPSRLR